MVSKDEAKPKVTKVVQPRKPKVMTKLQKVEEAMKAYKWWESDPLLDGRQWLNLEHAGLNFVDEYQPHNVKLLYDGKEVILTPDQEEVATFFAALPEDGQQLGNAEVRQTFIDNFFDDWKELLGEGHIIQHFEKCDFSPVKEYLERNKVIKKAATDSEKALVKAKKEKMQLAFGFAIVDGHLEKVGNVTAEPPGLFRGRGKHPKTGQVKQRIYPNTVTINIGETCAAPQCPIPGYAWEGVQCDPTVSWLSSWKETVLNSVKYMQLAASSSFKGKSDMCKYSKAMKLKGYIGKIRKDYTARLTSSDPEVCQIATCMWVIDKLALRVGGEKGEDEADTVGCCSLRREHLTFVPTPDGHSSTIREIELEFLGKDSMLFKQNIDFDQYGTVGHQVYRNLKSFCKHKGAKQDVFDVVTPTTLNAHLQTLMPGLSAKVFRTYNASETLQEKLPSTEEMNNLSVQDKLVRYNDANREVAILCNHQRTASNAIMRGIETQEARLLTLKKQKKELKEMRSLLLSGRQDKIRLKSNNFPNEQKALDLLERAKEAKVKAKTHNEKLAATRLYEEGGQLKKGVAAEKFKVNHLFANTPNSEDQIDKRIDSWVEKIKKVEVNVRDRQDNKEVSLGTSKINYMDPRISVAWCKRNEIPIEKIFAKTLREKFIWALSVPSDWRFDFNILQQSSSKICPGGRDDAAPNSNIKPVKVIKNEPKVKGEEIDGQ